MRGAMQVHRWKSSDERLKREATFVLPNRHFAIERNLGRNFSIPTFLLKLFVASFGQVRQTGGDKRLLFQTPSYESINKTRDSQDKAGFIHKKPLPTFVRAPLPPSNPHSQSQVITRASQGVWASALIATRPDSTTVLIRKGWPVISAPHKPWYLQWH